MLILGLDPGSLHTGFGLIDKQGSQLRVVEAGRISPPKDLELPLRLARLVAGLQELLRRTSPELVVMETPFFGLNARSAIVLAQARGALLATLAAQGLEIREVSPAEVKSAVTGNGRADKAQVAHMVRLLLNARSAKWAADATDALAVALCGAQRLRMDRLADSRRTAK
jgi:crossover junction endodeoxyribonuclease RuvC